MSGHTRTELVPDTETPRSARGYVEKILRDILVTNTPMSVPSLGHVKQKICDAQPSAAPVVTSDAYICKQSHTPPVHTSMFQRDDRRGPPRKDPASVFNRERDRSTQPHTDQPTRVPKPSILNDAHSISAKDYTVLTSERSLLRWKPKSTGTPTGVAPPPLSTVYDPSIKFVTKKGPDQYKDDEDPGYRIRILSEQDLREEIETRAAETDKALRVSVFDVAAAETIPGYRRESQTYSRTASVEDTAFASLHSSGTPRSVVLRPPVHRDNKSPAEISHTAGDDELFSALPASPNLQLTQETNTVKDSPSRARVSPNVILAKLSEPRPPSPNFGNKLRANADTTKTLVPAPPESCQQSPTFGAARTVERRNEIPLVKKDILEDAKRWDATYAQGDHRAHRELKRRNKVNTRKFIDYPPSDATGYPIAVADEYLDCFNLKIIFERDKTGFQESRDFRADCDTIIAGKYQIQSSLGQAAFSKAFKCLDLFTEKEVCVKMIRNDKDYIDQSLDEIALLRYLNANARDIDAKRCLRLLDSFYYKEHLFLVTELLGDNLYSFSQKVKSSGKPYFSLGRLQKIAYQILVALEFVHTLRLIHCDLKPENILVLDETEPLVKVIDFGSSCFEDDRLSSYVQSRSYRAPEVLLSLCYDQKVDIWSLGCILAEVWTGFVLFQNEGVPSMMARIAGIIGEIPYYMVARCKSTRDLFTTDGQLYQYIDDTTAPTSRGIRQVRVLLPKPSSLQQRLRVDDKLFLSFMTALLQIDPCKRPTAKEALEHEWLKPGLYADGL